MSRSRLFISIFLLLVFFDSTSYSAQPKCLMELVQPHFAVGPKGRILSERELLTRFRSEDVVFEEIQTTSLSSYSARTKDGTHYAVRFGVNTLI